MDGSGANAAQLSFQLQMNQSIKHQEHSRFIDVARHYVQPSEKASSVKCNKHNLITSPCVETTVVQVKNLAYCTAIIIIIILSYIDQFWWPSH